MVDAEEMNAAGAPLPHELEQLAGLAAAADAQLANAEQLPAAPGAEQAAADADASEHASITGALCLVATIASKAVPPIGVAYTPDACATIATEYLRCAEVYGWTFHRSASNPIIGLVAAAALPAVMHLEEFRAHFAQRKAAAAADAGTSLPSLQPSDLVDDRPHAGTRL